MNYFPALFISMLLASALCLPNVIRAATSLCPTAGARPSIRLQKLQATITTPQTLQEIAARRQQLSTSEPLRRYAAIIALALAGDLELFKQLLASQNASDIQTFALNYRNPDGSRCLTPSLEQLIISHLGNSALTRSLFAFLKQNLYRSPAFFDALSAHQPARSEINAWPHFVQALTATNLPDIAAQVLVQATTFHADATPQRTRYNRIFRRCPPPVM